MKRIFSLFLFLISCSLLQAQTSLGNEPVVNYEIPQKYKLVDVAVEGTTIDKNVVILLSGLPKGDTISVPGEMTSAAVDKLWAQGIFDDVRLEIDKIEGGYIWLKFVVVEKPRISKALFSGINGTKLKKSEKEKLNEKLSYTGLTLTEYRKAEMIKTINDHFRADGYLNCKTTLVARQDTSIKNASIVRIEFMIDKGKKVKIENLLISGNNPKTLPTWRIRMMMKDTKQKRFYNVFKSAKFIQDNYDKDKEKVLAKYRSKGYRDVRIVQDSVYKVSENRMEIRMKIDEGKQYRFRHITWVGNTKYSSEKLNERLGIKKGDVYNEQRLESRLFMSEQGNDISSLYMDDGYLFFQISPVEVNVEGDSIDYEMRIYEGRQATIRRVTVIGNTKTNDHVIMREIRTRPGQLFRRSDVIRSQRELASLGYFDPEKIQINPKPDPYSGTVDIEYVVEERPNDQVELSGGWGAGRLVGTLGLSFNNFSAKDFFNPTAWRPIPSGDGQKVSIRAQSNGLFFQSYNASFTEPWLGGKKPNSLSVSIFHSVQSNGVRANDALRQDVKISGASIGFGMRLKKPDDYFQLYQELSYQYYQLNNYRQVFSFANGYANNLSYRVTLQRNSTDQMIFPRSGADIKIIGQFTPPYSLFNNKDYSQLDEQGKYKYVEYFKWKFTSSWFTRLAGNLVLNTRMGFGYLGMYNKNVGTAPFERFYLGGSGLTGFALDGREIIALRGYDDQSLSSRTGNPIIAKYTWELRYPVSLNPSATVYGLAFVEAGNTWNNFSTFNPFDVYRSAGAGVRVFLPMFGLLGLDWGYRFDDVPGVLMPKSQVHFSIGFNLGEL